MTTLFRRVARVEVQRQDGQTVTVSGARVAFRVARDDTAHANRADVRVWNLTESTRSRLTLPCVVTLTAGYVGSEGVLFRGPVYDVVTERAGADTVLTLRASDRATGQVRVSRRGPVAWAVVARAVLDAVVSATGVRAGNAATAIGAAVAPAYARYSCAGPALAELDRVLEVAGLRVSVQGGELLVLDSATAVGVGQVVHLDADSGLVGSPQVAERPAPGAPKPTKASPKKGHQIKSLLRGDVRPGSVVSVTSRTLTGQYRVRAVTHSGDLEGADWYSDIEVEP